jgi:hypothetical protein
MMREEARKFDQALGAKPPVRKVSEEERLALQAEYAELLFTGLCRIGLSRIRN